MNKNRVPITRSPLPPSSPLLYPEPSGGSGGDSVSSTVPRYLGSLASASFSSTLSSHCPNTLTPARHLPSLNYPIQGSSEKPCSTLRRFRNPCSSLASFYLLQGSGRSLIAPFVQLFTGSSSGDIISCLICPHYYTAKIIGGWPAIY